MSDVMFKLVTPQADSRELSVVSLTGTERANDTYRFDLVCRATVGVSRVMTWEEEMPGTRATLKLGDRSVHGIVTELFVARTIDRGAIELHLVLEPRLRLMTMNVDHRIWQELSAVEVAAELLSSWAIEHDVRTQGRHRTRVYLTQHQESDYAFLRRILAEEGIFFLFEHDDSGDEPGQERVVLADEAALSPEVGALRFVGETDAMDAADRFDGVARFGRSRRIRPQRVLMGDYDFRHPGLPNLTKGEADDPLPVAASADQLRQRHHQPHAEIEGAAPESAFDEERARRTLEQHRRPRFEAQGTGTSRRLQAGHRFQLEGHGVDYLNGGYCVLSIEHEGHVAELTDAGEATYVNRFVCVPEHVAPRPDVPPAPRRHGPETATVVGAGEEDIATDDQGRVRVKFHWDLAERTPDRRSCWIRVAQPWAGTHFGAQFIPRVGDEVVVMFLGGDPDRPLITGSLYNGTHPTPFDLPDEKATSGFRTQSTPGGEGFNELSFRDTAGDERVFIHAERDLVAEVGKDHSVTVKGHQKLQAYGHQALVATLGQSMQVGGAQIINVLGDQQVTAAGSALQSVTGNADIVVGQQRTLRVDGREHVEIKGASNAIYRDDQTVRVLGHQTTIVGQHDARRAHNLHVEGSSSTHATGSVRITSDKDLELAVGDSVVRITPDAIELHTPNLRIFGEALETRATATMVLEAPDQVTLKSKKVLMESESAFLGLGKVAKLKGELVKLNCEDDPVDELDAPEPPTMTTISLADEDGKPLPNQRFTIILADGTEKTGTLDENGEAELELDQSGEIIFPDVHRPRPA